MTDKEKLPPQNIEAEQSVLGSLMMDKEAIFKVVDFLQPKDFYKKEHQEIYKAAIDIIKNNGSIDILSISSRLKEKKLMEKIGGKSYLTKLVNLVPTATHIAEYARIVQRKRILREMIQAGQEITLCGYDEEKDVEKLLDLAEQKIFSISQNSLKQNFVKVTDSLPAAFERIDELSKQKGDTRGVPTGFADLDNKLSGLQKTDLIILAARPSMGKSSLAFDIAKHVSVKKNIPVGVFSLEMSNDQIIDKLLSSTSKVGLWNIRTGRLKSEGDPDDFTRLQEAMNELSGAPLYIEDAGTCNIMQMRAMARRLQAEKGLGLIIIDYLQLVQPLNSTESMVQQMTEISRSLKSLAKELNVPVMALSQLSRAVEQRRPQIPRLSDLRETGALEQDADVVLFIYREDYYREEAEQKNVADIIIAKHRNGPVGKVQLYFDEKTASFSDLEKRYKTE